MKKFVLLFVIWISIATGCNSLGSEPGQAEEPEPALSLLPSSGDYTFQRYIEDMEHTEYRVLYSQVTDSDIVQVKIVQELDSDDSTDIAESNNFYEELDDGIYGYLVLSEDFPADWTAKDIKTFPKTKIISYPLEAGSKWIEKLPDIGVEVTYHIRSINDTLETPAQTFDEVIVIDFEEKNEEGQIFRKGNSTFAPQIGWIRHEIEDELLKDIHLLERINER